MICKIAFNIDTIWPENLVRTLIEPCSSVIDKEKQYFLAEATKTIQISDTSKSKDEGDGLWVGCATVEKEGRLCEQTIKASSEPGQFPMFTVSNLEDDPRFNDLPFVRGAPFFKFYAGTPLTTKRGINIGSLFILDGAARPPLIADEVDLMGTLAQSIMKHMELCLEAEERKKILRLSMGMNAFVEGKRQLESANTQKLFGSRWGKDDGPPALAKKRALRGARLPQIKQAEPITEQQRPPGESPFLSRFQNAQLYGLHLVHLPIQLSLYVDLCNSKYRTR